MADLNFLNRPAGSASSQTRIAHGEAASPGMLSFRCNSRCEQGRTATLTQYPPRYRRGGPDDQVPLVPNAVPGKGFGRHQPPSPST